MRILVIIIAMLALLGGIAQFFGGILGLFSGVLMLTTDFESVPEIAAAPEMSPQTIGLIFLLIAFLMSFNRLIFIIFAVGAFIRKRWARFLGIFAYALNIFAFFITITQFDAARLDDSLYFRQFRGACLYNYSGIFKKSAFKKPIGL